MATNAQRAVQKNWLGGMNTFSAEDALSNNQAYLLQNITLMNRLESLSKISGSIKYLRIERSPAYIDSTFINGMFTFVKANGDTVQLVSFSDPDGQHLAEFTPIGFTEITAFSTPFGQSVKDWVSFAGKVYFVTGENAVFSWDSVASTYTRTALPLSFGPTIIEMYNGRAYYAGDATNPSRIIYSKPLLPSTFNSPTDFVDVSDSLGDGITDLRPLGSALICFKKRSIHVIEGSPPRNIREVSAMGVGAVSANTVQRTSVGIVFLSELGVYTFNGSEVKKLSLNIEATLNSVLANTINEFSSVFYKNVYYLFYRDATSLKINKGFAFALDTLQFGVLGITALDNFYCNYNIVLSSFDANNDWLANHDDSNVILKMNSNNYPYYYKDEVNTALPLVADVTTHWEDFGNPVVIKELRSLHFLVMSPLNGMEFTLEYFAYGKTNTYTGTILADGTISIWNNVNWNSFLWEPANKYQYKAILPAGIVCERCRLKIKSAEPTELFSLMSLEYRFIPRREI